jgi:hypothetical protein
MIEITAVTSGTSARNEAKTKPRTTSAPNPPITASSSTPGPPLPPLSLVSASKPVRCTEAAPDLRARTRGASRLLRLGVLSELRAWAGARLHEREHGAPVLETKVSLPVEA